jgi:hypothetical protein
MAQMSKINALSRVLNQIVKTRNKITKQLRNLRTNNPKEYWKIPNSGRHKKQPNISIENLLQFMNWFEVFFMYSFMIASSPPALLFFNF